MNRSVLTLVFSLLSIAGVSAQTKDVIGEVDANLTQLRIAARHVEERNEDIEILRRLLNKLIGLPDVSKAYPSPSTIDYEVRAQLRKPDDRAQRVNTVLGTFDGVHLKGAGVVYTLRIPVGADLTYDPKSQAVGLSGTCNLCHQPVPFHASSFNHSTSGASNCTNCHKVEVPPVLTPPLSDWDRVRMELRGEKPAVPEPKKVDKPRGVLCDSGSLAEQVIGQLSAHAKNVRHLGEKESITVVVTFDSLPGATQAAATSGPVGKPGFTPNELQALALGDLHTKQGKHTEAVEAYLMGLVRFHESVTLSFPPSIPYEDATAAIQDMTASVRNTYKALAAAYLQLGHVDDAKAALEKATSLTVNVSAAKGADKPKAVGPAKLILSVTKADLNTAKDTAAVKKAIRIERMNFPAAEEKKATK